MEKEVGPILYFVEGEVPTNAEFTKAAKFMNQGPILEFVSLVNLDFNRELIQASGVAGKVPEVYKEYPIVDKPVHKEPVKESAKE